jgi:hypothetical protein
VILKIRVKSLFDYILLSEGGKKIVLYEKLPGRGGQRPQEK